MSQVKELNIDSSLLKRAKKGDIEAIKQMFAPFIGPDSIQRAECFGKYGAFLKTYSFVCLTDKKIAVLEYGPFSKFIYQDAFVEDINSGIIYRPSVTPLYIIGTLLCLTIVGILLLNGWIRLYYSLNKSGMVWSVREGISVYAFANRSKINEVTNFWRLTSVARGQRKMVFKV